MGSGAIRGYWERATSTQEWAEVRIGAPFVEGDLVAVEWWTTMVDDGVQITLPGCLLLRFAPDGRCQTLREYWASSPASTTRTQAGRVARSHRPRPGARHLDLSGADTLWTTLRTWSRIAGSPFTFRPPKDMPRGQTPGRGR